MSANLIIAVWTQFPEGGGKLQALLALAEAANEQGNCCLRIEQLAATARLSRRTMQRAVDRLRDERWIVTSRMLGQGARLVYQLNLPLLGRSARRNHDEAAVHAQRVRPLGATEAHLLERTSLRLPRRQNDAATEPGVTVALEAGRHDDTCQDGAANELERPADALEETPLACQEKYRAVTVEEVAAQFHELEDESQGATPPGESHGSLYAPPTAPDGAIFGADESFAEFEDDLAAMRAQAERAGKSQGFVPRQVRA